MRPPLWTSTLRQDAEWCRHKTPYYSLILSNEPALFGADTCICVTELSVDGPLLLRSSVVPAVTMTRADLVLCATVLHAFGEAWEYGEESRGFREAARLME